MFPENIARSDPSVSTVVFECLPTHGTPPLTLTCPFFSWKNRGRVKRQRNSHYPPRFPTQQKSEVCGRTFTPRRSLSSLLLSLSVVVVKPPFPPHFCCCCCCLFHSLVFLFSWLRPQHTSHVDVDRIAEKVLLETDLVNDNYFYSGYLLGYYTENNCPRYTSTNLGVYHYRKASTEVGHHLIMSCAPHLVQTNVETRSKQGTQLAKSV